ncbi:MAG: hypothetical protein HS108_09805 [Planctomycetes bacterium]|jgi:hypothetical protein|nr:hypothetical protein [Planctomycetota bacterium]MCL4728870.1 hypothetical protein [Planctomycetota bacterium]
MSAGNTQRRKRGTDRRTAKVDRREAPVNATVEISTSTERKQLLDTCSQIGALIIGQRFDRMAQGVEVLQKQASGLLLKQHLEVWLPRFEEHYNALEKVVGKNLEINQQNLVNELKAKAKAAGYATMKDFLTKVILPVVSYHGLLLHLNNNAGVALPANVREQVIQRMNAINKVLGGTCAAMFLQESMGLG